MTFSESIDASIEHFKSLPEADQELIETACPKHKTEREILLFLHGFNVAVTVLTGRFPNLRENALVTYDIASVLGAVASKLSPEGLEAFKQNHFGSLYETED